MREKRSGGTSIEQAEATGRISFPSPKERIAGGHAIVTVGYDDKMKIKNKYGKVETTGQRWDVASNATYCKNRLPF